MAAKTLSTGHNPNGDYFSAESSSLKFENMQCAQVTVN